MQAIPVYGRHVKVKDFRAKTVSWARPATWREPQKATTCGMNTYGVIPQGMVSHG